MAQSPDTTSDIHAAVTDAVRNSASLKDGVGAQLHSAFDSSKILNDGQLFGLKISKGAENTIRVLIDQFIPHVAGKVSENARDYIQKFALSQGKTHKEAIALGGKYGRYVGYSVVLAQPLAELAATAYQTSSRLNDLRLAVTPILRANGYNPTLEGIFSDGNNEVIRNARAKVYNIGVNELVKTTARSVALIPAFYTFHNQQQAKEKELDERDKLKLLADAPPEEYEAYVKEKLGGVSSISEGQGQRLRDILSKNEEKYQKEFESFRSKNKTKIRRDVEKEIESGLLEVERYKGVRESQVYQRGKGGKLESTKDNRKIVDHIVEERTKQEFAKKSLPWDEDWIPANTRYGRGEKPNTLKRSYEEAHAKITEMLNEQAMGATKVKKESKESDKMLTQGMLGLGSLAGEMLEGMLTTKDAERLKHHIALDYITSLSKQLKENAQIELISGPSGSNEEYGFAQYVHKIFQKNQIDSGYAEIGDRYFEHFKEAGWSDKNIQKLDDAELSAYEVAIKHTAKYIEEGRMDPLALINLVGQRKIVAKSGKSFSVLSPQADEDDVKQALLKEIDRQAALLKPNYHMAQEQISEQLAGYTFTTEELRAAFSANGLKGDERAFMFALIDANTPDDKVIKQLTGLDEHHIKQLRLESQERFSTLLDAAIREIADMKPEQFASLIQQRHLTESEIGTLQQIVREASESRTATPDVLHQDSRRVVENAVTNILMAKRDEDPGFWQDRIRSRAQAIEQEHAAHNKEVKESKTNLLHGLGDKLDGREPEVQPNMQRHMQRHKPYTHEMDEMGSFAGKLNHSRADQSPWGLAG